MITVELLNRAGTMFVDYGLAMLIQSSILIILILIADRFMKQRVRAVVRYGLWLLVMVKLVLPVGVAAPWSPFYWLPGQSQPVASLPVTDTTVVSQPVIMSGNDFATSPALITDQPAKLSVNDPVPTSAPARHITEPIPTVTDPIIQPQPAPIPAVASKPAGPELNWKAFVFLGELITVLILLALLAQRYWFVRSLVAQAGPCDERSYEILLKAKARLNISRSVRLGFSGSSMSPSVCGLTRPVILIPADMADKLSDSQLEAVLLHELVHVRRGDLWVNLLQTLLQILYFWHPLLWLANDRIRAIREQAVDEQVLVAMADNADAYPETLVHVSKLAWSRPMLSLRLIGVVESKSALTARIRHILSRPIPGTAKIGRKGILTIILAAAIILPMAQGATGNPEFIIKGKVVDAATGQPIANVRVGDVENYNKGIFSALTNEKGEYSYKTWYEEHSIQAKAIGYKTADEILLTKALGSETEKVIDFKLVLDLPEIELSTHKYVKAGSPASFVLTKKGGSVKSSDLMPSVCPNIVIVLDGQRYKTNTASNPYMGGYCTITNNSFVERDKRELSVGKHTVQAEYEPHTININGNTVEVGKLISNVVEFEVVESLPDGYLQPKHYENAKQILDECGIKVLFGFEDITENFESYWFVKGYTPPFNIAAKVYLESESGKKLFIKDLLVAGNVGLAVKNETFIHQYGDGSDKNLEIITNNWFVTEKWRVVLEPSQDVVMTNPAIRSYCDDVYYGPYEKIQIPLDGGWFYGSGIDTKSEFGLANIELLKSQYIDLDNIKYLKQSTDAELRYDNQSSSLVPVSDNGVWAVKLAKTYSLKNLVEQVKQALKDGNAGKNIVNAIPAGDNLFDMYVVRTDKGANYILVVNTVKDNQQGTMNGFNNELFLLTISDGIINEANEAELKSGKSDINTPDFNDLNFWQKQIAEYMEAVRTVDGEFVTDREIFEKDSEQSRHSRYNIKLKWDRATGWRDYTATEIGEKIDLSARRIANNECGWFIWQGQATKSKVAGEFEPRQLGVMTPAGQWWPGDVMDYDVSLIAELFAADNMRMLVQQMDWDLKPVAHKVNAEGLHEVDLYTTEMEGVKVSMSMVVQWDNGFKLLKMLMQINGKTMAMNQWSDHIQVDSKWFARQSKSYRYSGRVKDEQRLEEIETAVAKSVTFNRKMTAADFAYTPEVGMEVYDGITDKHYVVWPDMEQIKASGGKERISISGKVYLDGKPASGVEVSVITYYEQKSKSSRQVKSVTDKDGKYSLETLVPGMKYNVSATTAAGMKAVKKIKAQADGSDVDGVDIYLASGYSLAGKVLDWNGKPIAGAKVRFKDMNGVETDSTGRYSMAGLKSDVSYTVDVSALDCSPYKQNNVRVIPDENDVFADLDFNMERERILSGRVVDKDGKGIPDFRVMSFLNSFIGNWQWSNVYTDENGYFELGNLGSGPQEVGGSMGNCYFDPADSPVTIMVIDGKIGIKDKPGRKYVPQDIAEKVANWESGYRNWFKSEFENSFTSIDTKRVAALADMAGSTDEVVRLEGLVRLGNIEAISAVDMLVDIVKANKDKEDVRLALRALGRIGELRVTECLIDKIKDTDELTAAVSRVALIELFGKDHGNLSDNWVKAYNDWLDVRKGLVCDKGDERLIKSVFESAITGKKDVALAAFMPGSKGAVKMKAWLEDPEQMARIKVLYDNIAWKNNDENSYIASGSLFTNYVYVKFGKDVSIKGLGDYKAGTRDRLFRVVWRSVDKQWCIDDIIYEADVPEPCNIGMPI